MAFTQGYALIIGVGSHKHAQYADVPISVTDAKAVSGVLQDPKYCGYSATRVQFLHDETATKIGILTALDRLSMDAGTGGTVFLFYCGHGAPGNDGNYYLVSNDAQVESGRVVAGTGVSEAELLKKLIAIQARRVFLVFNACYSGNISPTLDVSEPALEVTSLPEDTSSALLATGSGRIIITASRETQKSYIGSGSLSIFTQAVVDGLRGKGVANKAGYISAYNLYEYVFEQVHEFVSERYNLEQEPELTVLKGIGPFAVALYKGASSLGEFDERQPAPNLPAVRAVKPENAKKMLNKRVEQSGDVDFGQNNQFQVEGSLVGGNLTAGGDFTGRDSTEVQGDQITAGDIIGNTGVILGKNNQQTIQQGVSAAELAALFAPILQATQNAAPEKRAEVVQTVQELQKEVARGEKADESKMHRLVDKLIDLAPGAVSAAISAFANPILGSLSGPLTKWVVEKLQGK